MEAEGEEDFCLTSNISQNIQCWIDLDLFSNANTVACAFAYAIDYVDVHTLAYAVADDFLELSLIEFLYSLISLIGLKDFSVLLNTKPKKVV